MLDAEGSVMYREQNGEKKELKQRAKCTPGVSAGRRSGPGPISGGEAKKKAAAEDSRPVHEAGRRAHNETATRKSNVWDHFGFLRTRTAVYHRVCEMQAKQSPWSRTIQASYYHGVLVSEKERWSTPSLRFRHVLYSNRHLIAKKSS